MSPRRATKICIGLNATIGLSMYFIKYKKCGDCDISMLIETLNYKYLEVCNVINYTFCLLLLMMIYKY